MITDPALQPPPPDIPAAHPPPGAAAMSRVGAASTAPGTSGAAVPPHAGSGDGARAGLASAATAADASQVMRRAAPPAHDGRRGLRILVTDDDAFAARLMRRLLEQDGHTVRTAGTLREALALADGDPLDVLITDHLLPDGTGCDLLRQLRARGPVAAISITGFNDPEHARHIAAAHFTARFVKPITLAQLNAALAQVVTPSSDGPPH